MISLELLAPAKDKTVGIAAIDCGADAVYIGGPGFGNRKAAGNSFEDIAELCEYAHRFGVRVYLTVNTLVYDDEWEELHAQMLQAQEAGVDAFIFREERLLQFPDIHLPMHASTQCSIRSVERARYFDGLGCSRLILERGLSLDDIRQIRAAVGCELEFFVHGALCVCYSGECRLSEYLDGRSADRGECIQACRSLYDLQDSSGRVLVRNKALLSLRDFNLLSRLQELAEAGVCSFKIEGRLKNASYVKNVVREYSLALDKLVARFPELYRRASFGKVSGGFMPDSNKTFNRGYTQWWLDGKRGSWASMDAPKSMGEYVGEVVSVRPSGAQFHVELKPASAGLRLNNGDGFAFSNKGSVVGFRGDRCEGFGIWCKRTDGLRPRIRLFRNINASFEREIEARSPRREVSVDVDVRVFGDFTIDLAAQTEDGRKVLSSFNADVEKAENRERAEAMLREQLGKRSGEYAFRVRSVTVETRGGALPLLSASTINSMRRCLASDIPAASLSRVPWQPCSKTEPNDIQDINEKRLGGLTGAIFNNPVNINNLHSTGQKRGELQEPLMRTRYCVKYELGLCPRHQGAKTTGPLFLVNNGRRLALGFHCDSCEMTVEKAE